MEGLLCPQIPFYIFRKKRNHAVNSHSLSAYSNNVRIMVRVGGLPLTDGHLASFIALFPGKNQRIIRAGHLRWSMQELDQQLRF